MLRRSFTRSWACPVAAITEPALVPASNFFMLPARYHLAGEEKHRRVFERSATKCIAGAGGSCGVVSCVCVARLLKSLVPDPLWRVRAPLSRIASLCIRPLSLISQRNMMHDADSFMFFHACRREFRSLHVPPPVKSPGIRQSETSCKHLDSLHPSAPNDHSLVPCSPPSHLPSHPSFCDSAIAGCHPAKKASGGK